MARPPPFLQVSMVPNQLPSSEELQQMVQDLPLNIVTFRDEPHLYLAVLQVHTPPPSKHCCQVPQQAVPGLGQWV